MWTQHTQAQVGRSTLASYKLEANWQTDINWFVSVEACTVGVHIADEFVFRRGCVLIRECEVGITRHFQEDGSV